MKNPLRSICVCVMAGLVTSASAQTEITIVETPSGTLDTNVNTIATNSGELKKLLDDLLKQAQKQTDALNLQLQRMGDYKNQPASVGTAQGAMGSTQSKIVGDLSSANNYITLKSNQELATERAAVEGNAVFKDSDDGTFKGIGDTKTVKVRETREVLGSDGKPTGKSETVMVEKTVNRDASLYEQEAKKQFDLMEFYKTRDDALAKQKQLEAARLRALQDQAVAQDAVETQRLATLISTIDAELITCRQDVANASQEVLMHEKALALQQQLDLKAKNERPDRKPTTEEQMKALIEAAQKNSKTPPAAKNAFPFGKRFGTDSGSGTDTGTGTGTSN